MITGALSPTAQAAIAMGCIVLVTGGYAVYGRKGQAGLGIALAIIGAVDTVVAATLTGEASIAVFVGGALMLLFSSNVSARNRLISYAMLFLGTVLVVAAIAMH